MLSTIPSVLAHGYVEMEMFLEANDALDDIDPMCSHLPEVLAVRVSVYQALQRWALMEVVGTAFRRGSGALGYFGA